MIQVFLQKQWSLDLIFSRNFICGAARLQLVSTLTLWCAMNKHLNWVQDSIISKAMESRHRKYLRLTPDNRNWILYVYVGKLAQREPQNLFLSALCSSLKYHSCPAMPTNMSFSRFSYIGRSLNVSFLEERWFTWFKADILIWKAIFIFPI